MEARLLPLKHEDQQTPGGGCFGCGQKGHRYLQCTERTSSAKGGTGNRQPARAHASMKVAPKVCPACNGQHTYQD